MFVLISLIVFIFASILGGMIIGGLADAWIIPTYFPGTASMTYEHALIISAILVIIFFILFSPSIHSDRLKEYMRYGYRKPETKGTKSKK